MSEFYARRGGQDVATGGSVAAATEQPGTRAGMTAEESA